MVAQAHNNPPMTQHPLLATRGLGMTFNDSVVALHDVTVSFSNDDFVVVLGPSGAGKSTLLRSLNRLNNPTQGKVLFEGNDVTRASGARLRRLRQNVGMIFQQFNLVGRRSVLQNVLAGRASFAKAPMRLPLTWVGVFSRADREAAFDALCRVGIEVKAYERADHLSGGQQQRVAIARLIAQRPKAVLADEPIASLDPASADVVMRMLRELHHDQGIPVVVNLHQVEMARRYAKRIIGMRAGRVVFDGPPDRLDDQVVRELYHGRTSNEQVHQNPPRYAFEPTTTKNDPVRED